MKLDSKDPYVNLAIKTLKQYITDKTVPSAQTADAALLSERAGAFVSLKKHGELRGCIGTIAPTQDNVANEIIMNAISAGTRDPRFPPVRPEELDELVCSVDILGDPEQVSSLDELDVKRYGVIVTNGHRRGLLLPDLDGVNTPEQQVHIAMQKAGISPEEPIGLERFEVVRHVE